MNLIRETLMCLNAESTEPVVPSSDNSAMSVEPVCPSVDWFTDPCRTYTTLKNHFGAWTPDTIRMLGECIPVIQENIRALHLRKQFTYDNIKIDVGRKLGAGTYGVIYAGKLNGRSVALKLLTRPTDDAQEFLREFIIHSELFCAMRGRWGTGARVPKIEFVSKFMQKNGSFAFIIGMEELHGSAAEVMNQLPTEADGNGGCAYMIQTISILLRKLQERQFMHRDLHFGNIMFKRRCLSKLAVADCNPRYYIIDFGESTLDINGVMVNSETDLYRKNIFNPTFDLKILCFSILEFYKNLQSVRLNLLVFLVDITEHLNQYVNFGLGERRLFHEIYKYYDIYNSHFEPRFIETKMDRILSTTEMVRLNEDVNGDKWDEILRGAFGLNEDVNDDKWDEILRVASVQTMPASLKRLPHDIVILRRFDTDGLNILIQSVRRSFQLETLVEQEGYRSTPRE